MEVFWRAQFNMLRLSVLQFILGLLGVADGRLLDALPHFQAPPSYLPVNFSLLHADSAFFLKEANQDIMRNSSLLARTEPFFVFRARQMPVLNASYGPLTMGQPVTMDLLQPSGTMFPSSSPTSSSADASSSSSSSASASAPPPPLFTFNWEVQTFIITDRVYLRRPRVQVLFYVSGRDWDDYSTVGRLPCVRLSAFHETQEARGLCQLAGDLGLCVAELEPLAGWFGTPSIVPGGGGGRSRGSSSSSSSSSVVVPLSPFSSPVSSSTASAADPFEGTPVELYYRLLEPSPEGGCPANTDDPRGGGGPRGHQRRGGYRSPMRRVGSVRLLQAPAPPQLGERWLDGNFLILMPVEPIQQREAVSAFVATVPHSPVEAFTLR
ncbi:transmembrane protein 132C-like [Engraulis encrasicolus]|uniref:transmembrane protein 132C-like n=1 Tax=Engraulis encrasicolus TaxID=184585 RepID=UPI002FD13FC9